MHTRAINDWRDVPEIKTDEQAVEMFGPSFRGVVSAAEKMGGRAAVYVVGVAPASGTDRTGAPRVVDDGSCCGVAPGGRHYETCPRTVAWKATRCGARPPRGAVLDLGDYNAGYRLATGEEACHNGKGCDGCHKAPEDFREMSWTAAPVFLDCAVCAQRVMPHDGGPVLYSAKDAGKNRVGTICESCRGTLDAANWPRMVWRGDRLVRKDVAAGMEQRLTVCGRELDAWGVACEVPRKAGEPDDEYRQRVLRGFYREMSFPLGLRTATAREQARAKGLAELTREGTTSAPEMRDPDPRIQKWVDAAKRIAARPTMEIVDKCGIVLAFGEVRVRRVSHELVRMSGEFTATVAGTAAAWHLRRADRVRLFSGPVSRHPGVNTFRLNTTAFSPGATIAVAALHVYGSAEEMRALFGDECAGLNPPGTYHCGGCDGKVPHGTPHRCPECECGAIGPDIADHLHAPGCPAVARRARGQRREREAPLVALVNAVPEGLDPTGWRAAVLAVNEAGEFNATKPGAILSALLRLFVQHGASDAIEVAMPAGLSDDDEVRYRERSAVYCGVYARAIAPHKAPPPERRQGGKAIRLTVDDGRNDE